MKKIQHQQHQQPLPLVNSLNYKMECSAKMKTEIIFQQQEKRIQFSCVLIYPHKTDYDNSNECLHSVEP